MGIRIRMGKILGMGMIGSERGGDRVIGNYGMRREFEFFFISSRRWDYYISAPPAGSVEGRVGNGARSRVTDLFDVIERWHWWWQEVED